MSSGLEGVTLGQYRLTERLGKGGMAEVYKAYQPSLDRYVAIKVLHAYFAEEEDFRNRFQREARAVARLRHSNIVQVYDFGVEDDVYYMAMEFLAGGTLKQRLRQASELLPPAEVLRIVERVAAALDYAHARNIYHRDVKPSNVMLTEDRQVILTDFGLAKMAEGSQYTRSGTSVGTPEYMAPEQGQGLTVDHRADVYSLGVVLYELVTGQLPYTADTPVAIIFQHIKDPLPLPRTLNPDLDEGIERVILKALAKSPEDRYQSAGDLAAALRQAMAVAGEDLPTPPPAPLPDTRVLPRETPPPLAETEPAVLPLVEADTVAELGERLEETIAERRKEAKSRLSGKKGFLAGCFVSLLVLACCVCALIVLGTCSDREGRPRPGDSPSPPPDTPAPAEPTPAEQPWNIYEGFGMSIEYPADWVVTPSESAIGQSVRFVAPRSDGAVFCAVYVRRQGPAMPLDRLLESLQARALDGDTLSIEWVGEFESLGIGDEEAIAREFSGKYVQNNQPFWGYMAAVLHGDQSYLILFMTPERYLGEVEDVFWAMKHSIRFMP